MKHSLIKNLESLKSEIKLTKAHKENMEDFLFSRISALESTNTQRISFASRLAYAFVPSFNFKPVAVFSMILVLLVGTSFGTVGAAKNTLPGDALYPFKITTESVMYSLAFTKEMKVSLAVQSAKNRINEIKKIMETDNSSVKIATVSNHLKDNLNKVQTAVLEINQTEVVKVNQDLMEIENQIAQVSENSEVSTQEIKDEVNKTTTIVLSVLIDSAENSEENETQQIEIDEQELKDRIAEKIAHLEETDVDATILTEIKTNLEAGELKLAIDGILALTSEPEESEIVENGEVKGEETASTTQAEIVENNNSSSTQTIILVPVSAIDILGIQQEEEIEEFNVGLK